MAKLSAKSGLSARQQKFAEIYHATGRNLLRAYEMAFLEENEDGDQVVPRRDPATMKASAARKMIEAGEPLPADPDRRKARLEELASAELADSVVQIYLQQLRLNAWDLADLRLEEQLVEGGENARAAAKIVRDEKERSERKRDFEAWVDMMCEAGAEIVVDFPMELEKDVECPGCGHAHRVKIPLEVTAPMAAMFNKTVMAQYEVKPGASEKE